MNVAVDHIFKTVPYAHQHEVFNLSRARPYFALLMEMGTGKSKVLIDTAAWLFNQGRINAALIVAPKSVCRSWIELQLPEHMPDTIPRRLFVNWTPSPRKEEAKQLLELFEPDPLCLKVLVMNVEALSTKKGYAFAESFLRGHQALMAIDESTRIKAPDAKRTKAAIKLGRLASYRRILTGTPVTQSPLDVFCQFEFLEHGSLDSSNYFSFKTRYAVLRRRFINGRQFDEIVGFQRLEELQRNIGAHSYRKLKRECLDLPEKIYAPTHHVELSPEQLSAYKALRDKALYELDGEGVITAPLVLTKILRLRQVLAGILPLGDSIKLLPSPRLDELLEICEDVEGKVIIWSSFIESIAAIHATLATRFGRDSVARFYGATSSDARQEIITRFQNPADPLRFFVGQIHTGGLGITLTEARTVIYHDHDWNLEARQQSEDRAHRIGQVNHVTYFDLVAKDTVDEVIIDSLKAKLSLADAVTGDGWRRLFKLPT